MAGHIGIDLGTTTTCIAICDGEHANVLEASQSNALAPSTITVNGDKWQIGKHWPGDKKKGVFIYEAKRIIGRDHSEKTLLKDVKRLSCFQLVDTSSPCNLALDVILQDLEDILSTGCDTLSQWGNDSPRLEYWKRFVPESAIDDDNKLREFARSLLKNDSAVQKRLRLRPMFVHRNALVEPEEISALILRHCKRQIEAQQHASVETCTITVPAYFADSQRLATIDAARIAGWKDVLLVNEPTAAAVAHVFDGNLEDGCYLLPDLGGGTFDVSLLLVETQDNGQKVFVVKATGGDNLLGGANFTEVLMDIAKARGASVDDEELRAVCEQTKTELSTSHEATFEIDIAEDTITQDEFRIACRELLEKISSIVSKTLQASGMEASDLCAVIMAGGASGTIGFRDAVAAVVERVNIVTPLNPSQLCARGAAFIASGKALITEVLSRSIGIELVDGSFSILIQSANPLPLEIERTYSPSSLEYPTLITLYEGEEDIANENLLLGEFEVSGFTSLDEGFQVCIKVDINRDVTVRAVISGETQGQLNVQRSQKFTCKQISCMATLCSQRCPIGSNSEQQLQDRQVKRAASPSEETSPKRTKVVPE